MARRSPDDILFRPLDLSSLWSSVLRASEPHAQVYTILAYGICICDRCMGGADPYYCASMHSTPSIVGLEYYWKMSDLDTSLPLNFYYDHYMRFFNLVITGEHCLEAASQFCEKGDPAFCLLLWSLVSDCAPILRVDHLTNVLAPSAIV